MSEKCEVKLGCKNPGVRQVQTLVSAPLALIGVESLRWDWACAEHAPLYESPAAPQEKKGQ